MANRQMVDAALTKPATKTSDSLAWAWRERPVIQRNPAPSRRAVIRIRRCPADFIIDV
jgi:hypothetical protein